MMHGTWSVAHTALVAACICCGGGGGSGPSAAQAFVVPSMPAAGSVFQERACTRTPPSTPQPPSRSESFLGAMEDSWLKELQDAAGSSGLPIGPTKMAGLAGGPKTLDRRVTENNALKEWLGDNGVWVWDKSGWGIAPHALAVAIDTVDENENEDAGRGFIAAKDIKEGDELFSMPIHLLLTKDRAREEFGADVITDDLSEYISIALLLAKEKAKGPKSFWKTYLDVLPTLEEVNPTFVWPDEDLELLKGSPVVAATASMRRKLNSEYASVKDDIFAARPDLFPGEDFGFEVFQWAFSMLFSRAIRLGNLSTGETVALIPYADLFNHNPFANSYIDARQTGLWTKEDEVTVYSDRAYKQMEQVFISYGPKSNADLLLLYGFSLDRNPFNSVEVTVSLSEEDPLREKKKVFLEEAGLPPIKNFPLYNDRYPDELLQYLRLVQLSEEQLGGLDLEDLAFEKKLSDVNELMVLDAIKNACQTALKGYPTTEDEDSALMSDRGMFGALSKSQRMAIKHRRQEKRILRRTLAAVGKERERLTLPLWL